MSKEKTGRDYYTEAEMVKLEGELREASKAAWEACVCATKGKASLVPFFDADIYNPSDVLIDVWNDFSDTRRAMVRTLKQIEYVREYFSMDAYHPGKEGERDEQQKGL